MVAQKAMPKLNRLAQVPKLKCQSLLLIRDATTCWSLLDKTHFSSVIRVIVIARHLRDTLHVCLSLFRLIRTVTGPAVGREYHVRFPFDSKKHVNIGTHCTLGPQLLHTKKHTHTSNVRGPSYGNRHVSTRTPRAVRSPYYRWNFCRRRTDCRDRQVSFYGRGTDCRWSWCG